jgi:hypothetical protein
MTDRAGQAKSLGAALDIDFSVHEEVVEILSRILQEAVFFAPVLLDGGFPPLGVGKEQASIGRNFVVFRSHRVVPSHLAVSRDGADTLSSECVLGASRGPHRFYAPGAVRDIGTRRGEWHTNAKPAEARACATGTASVLFLLGYFFIVAGASGTIGREAIHRRTTLHRNLSPVGLPEFASIGICTSAGICVSAET